MAGRIDQETAHDALEHYIALKLTTLGVVQGLAFSHLAERIPKSGTSSALHCVLFAVCILVTVRVFQTYATAAIEKSRYLKFQYFDLISMFLVGLLEYWIFDAYEGAPDARNFFIRIIILSVLAIALYCRAIMEISRQDYSMKRAHILGEWIDISISSSVALLAGVGVYASVRQLSTAPQIELAVAALISIALLLGVALSMSSLLRPSVKHRDRLARTSVRSASLADEAEKSVAASPALPPSHMSA